MFDHPSADVCAYDESSDSTKEEVCCTPGEYLSDNEDHGYTANVKYPVCACGSTDLDKAASGGVVCEILSKTELMTPDGAIFDDVAT